MDQLLSIDVGCGAKKRPGHIGVDAIAGDGVDVVVDLEHAPLPFPDGSVGTIFSSHCIEHLRDTEKVFRELSRVCADGARIELWHPYSAHRDAFLPGHVAFLNEAFYEHLTQLAPRHWADLLGARWIVHELVFAIDGGVLADLEAHGFDAAFSVKHLQNVVTELGVFAELRKGGAIPERGDAPRKSYARSRDAADRRPLVPKPKPPEPQPRGIGEKLRRYLAGRAL